MTKNKLKTILFASLIVAMVLPFTGMQSANASHEDTPPNGPNLPGTPNGIPIEPDVEVVPDGNHPTGIPDGSMHELPTEPGGLHSPNVETVQDGSHQSDGNDGSHGPEIPSVPLRLNN